MKPLLPIILLAFLCPVANAAGQTVKIYTYEVLPPYAYTDENDHLTGVYIEIVRKAVSRMPSYDVEFVVVPWKRAKLAAETGEAFAILPPYFHAHDWLTDEEPKRPYIWPYSLPLLTQFDVVICNDKVPKGLEWPDGYHGLKFVMWRGDGRGGLEFEEMVKAKQIDLHLVNEIKETIAILEHDKADCTLTSRLSFWWWVERMKASGEYEIRDKELQFSERGVISVSQGFLGYTDVNAEHNFPFKKDFSQKFDIEIYKMRRSGELEDIIKNNCGIMF